MLNPPANASPTTCRGGSGQKRDGSGRPEIQDSPQLAAEIFNPQLEIPRDRIAEFCGRWNVVELSLFGSALREDFRPESDIDLLVRFSPGKEYGLFQLSRMREELEAIFGRSVDLVSEKAVERSENHIKRRQILATKVVIHAAG